MINLKAIATTFMSLVIYVPVACAGDFIECTITSAKENTMKGTVEIPNAKGQKLKIVYDSSSVIVILPDNTTESFKVVQTTPEEITGVLIETTPKDPTVSKLLLTKSPDPSGSIMLTLKMASIDKSGTLTADCRK